MTESTEQNHRAHKFRKHAVDRIGQRSITPAQEILLRINMEAFIPLGVEIGGRRSHELLYLPVDTAWFTIVRDLKNLEIITFLPVDYHNKCGWKISEDALNAARKIGEEYSGNSTSDDMRTSYAFSLIIETEHGRTKSISLGKHRINPSTAVEELKCDSELRRTVLGKISEKKIRLETVRGLAFKKRDIGDPVFLPFDEWFSSVSHSVMKYSYPDPDSLSDASIREALASNGIEGYPFLDADGRPVPVEKRVEAFRDFLRRERAKEARKSPEARI